MRAITALIARHPVPSYFVLTFAISWGGVLVVVGPGGIPGTAEQFEALLPVAVLAMLAGPAGAGILLTALLDGRAGVRGLLARVGRWRVGVWWYAVALLLAPLLMSAILLALSRRSPAFRPAVALADHPVGFVLVGLAIALGAGVLEELGWTGFAIPRLRRRHGVLTTGLIVGLAWAAWHWLVGVWASGQVSGPLALASYLIDPLLYLASIRVLMVWVYDRTGSVLIAMLMHVSVTATARLLGPTGIAGAPLLLIDILWAAAVGVVIAAVALADRRRALPPALRPRAA